MFFVFLGNNNLRILKCLFEYDLFDLLQIKYFLYLYLYCKQQRLPTNFGAYEYRIQS